MAKRSGALAVPSIDRVAPRCALIGWQQPLPITHPEPRRGGATTIALALSCTVDGDAVVLDRLRGAPLGGDVHREVVEERLRDRRGRVELHVEEQVAGPTRRERRAVDASRDVEHRRERGGVDGVEHRVVLRRVEGLDRREGDGRGARVEHLHLVGEVHLVVGAEHGIGLGEGREREWREHRGVGLVRALTARLGAGGDRGQRHQRHRRERARPELRESHLHLLPSKSSSVEIFARRGRSAWRSKVTHRAHRHPSPPVRTGVEPGGDHGGGPAGGVVGLRRRVGQRPRGHPRRPGLSLALPLRPAPHPDLGRGGHRTGRTRHERARGAPAQPARAGELARQPRRAVGRPAHDRCRRRMVRGRVRRTRSVVLRPRTADGRDARRPARVLGPRPGRVPR